MSTRLASDDRARALELHRDSIVIDGLDVSVLDADHWLAMRAGGVTAANLTVSVGGDFRSTCLELTDLNHRMATHADLVRPVRTVADIRAAKEEGRVGIIAGFQNTTPIENELRFIHVFRDLGVRIVQLTWNAANLVGDSCQESRNAGLTAFGRAVVRELNRQRILVDLSHCDERTSLDAMDASTAPVAMTHANPMTAARINRNKSDGLIRELASRGGVMGIVAIAEFLADDPAAADLAKYCDQIDYVADLVGIDHVGIGSDFTDRLPRAWLEPIAWGGAEVGPATLQAYADTGRFPFPYARGLESSADMPAITVELVRRGYGELDIRKVLGLNWLRLFEAAWGG